MKKDATGYSAIDRLLVPYLVLCVCVCVAVQNTYERVIR